MIRFETEYFQKFSYTENQIKQYFKNAKKDLDAAKKLTDPDIMYRICYDAIIKLGIATLAKHRYKIRSIPGHHVKILEKLDEIGKLKEEINFLQYVRRKRNIDLYDGGVTFTKTESTNLLKITEKVFQQLS